MRRSRCIWTILITLALSWRCTPLGSAGENPRAVEPEAAVSKASAALHEPKPLLRVDEPPPVQMFVPGFTVRRLPVELTNINNVRYRRDGTLVALAYNGNVYLLRDRDGDGLEETVELFWDNQGHFGDAVGMALTPPDYPPGDGVFITSNHQFSLVVDTDGDDRADEHILVADDWRRVPRGIAAIGVAVDPRDGSVYFGLGNADYTNPYEIDEDGVARYDPADERGSIQRMSPDLKSRETVCSGIRFPVGMAFDRHGEMFCTDQEGATWLANGNPFDELLHIQRGRHYGFPPRHPRHLSDVIDEPSVFDFTPQHQSTCGLAFNRAGGLGGDGDAVFGPSWWADDALVCGYSRGKLYRTKLVKTPAGYTAQNQIIASLNMLTVDACVAPDGSLVVATHSGGPDWGSGPSGKGQLYKITYDGRAAPQPIRAYPAGPRELRIAFDRPLPAAEALDLSQLLDGTHIEFGQYVRAGDRFEALRPGYAVVAHQVASPRYRLPVEGIEVAAGGRTLRLTTAAHPEQAHYAVTLPRHVSSAAQEESDNVLPQYEEIDLDYDLSGVAAELRDRTGEALWQGWLPHLDLTVARALTAGSAEHDALWQQLDEAGGRLVLRISLDLTDMLRPAVQATSAISYEWPDEVVTLVLRSPGRLEVTCGDAEIEEKTGPSGEHVVKVTVRPAESLISLEVALEASAAPPELNLSFYTAEDERERTVALRRLVVPWAPTEAADEPVTATREIAELEGGNWLRGRELFFGERGKCGKCHAIGGSGGQTGPDLSNLVHRDYESVLRDITQPSFAINPDYISFTVVLRDGRILQGPIRTVDGRAHVGDAEGKETVVPVADIARLEASTASIMPEQLLKDFSEAEQKELMTFLLQPPPAMPQYAAAEPPPARRLAEIEAVLAGAPETLNSSRPLRVLLVAGKKDHGPGEHDYPAWQEAWQRLLSMNAGTSVRTASEWPSAEEFASADVIVFYQRGTWTSERARDLDAYLERGGGLVFIHYAVYARDDAADFAQRIGLAAGSDTKYRHGPLEVRFDSTEHPIARNFDSLHLIDESYWQLTGDESRLNLLASAVEDGAPRAQFWTCEPASGRVFVSIPGHYAWTFDDPLFRILLLRGIAWVAGEPVDRFNDLVTAGARLVD